MSAHKSPKYITRSSRKAFISAVRRDAGSNREMVKSIEHASTANIVALVRECVVVLPAGWVVPTGARKAAIRLATAQAALNNCR